MHCTKCPPYREPSLQLRYNKAVEALKKIKEYDFDCDCEQCSHCITVMALKELGEI